MYGHTYVATLVGKAASATLRNEVCHPLGVPVSTNVRTVEGGCIRRKEPIGAQCRIGTDVKPVRRAPRVASIGESLVTLLQHMYGHTYVRSARRITWNRRGQGRRSTSSAIEHTGTTVVSYAWTHYPTHGRRCRVPSDEHLDAVPKGPRTNRTARDPRTTYVWPYIQPAPDW